MVSRAEQKQKTRRALIDAALHLGAQQGFSNLSLREVAREAGVAPTAFYRHFDNMEELSLILVDEVGLSLRQLMRKAVQRMQHRHSMVHVCVETFMDYIRNNSNLFRLLLGERTGSSSAFRQALYREVNHFVVDFIHVLEKECEEKQRPMAEIPIVAEAMTILAFNVGAEALDAPLHEHKAIARRIIRQLRILFRGAEALAQENSSPQSSK